MTSKKSSVNPTLFTFKGALKSSALAPAVTLFAGLMFMIVAFNTTSLFDVYQTDSGAYERNSAHFKYVFFESPEYYSMILPLLIAGAGALTAILLFKFITSKKTVNVYYSLGIKRENLFMGKYLAGAVLLSVAIIVPMVVMFFVNIAACGYSKELLIAFLYITLTFLSVALTAFSLTSAVFGAVGTAFETTLFSAVLLFLPTIFFYALQTLMGAFVYGNPYGEAFCYSNENEYSATVASLTDKFSFLNPVFFNKTELALYSVMDKAGKTNIRLDGDNAISGNPDFLMPLLWLVIAGVLCAVGVAVFKKRKAEICGFIGMNKYLNTVTVFVAAFFLFCFAVNMLPLNIYQNVAIGAAIFIIVYIVLELLILRDTRKFKKGLFKLPAELAVSGIIVAVFATGLLGFSTRIPEESEIKSAAISFAGVNDEFAYAAQESYYWSTGVEFTTNGLLVDGFESENDIKAIRDIHESIAENTAGERSETAVRIVYKLKDGSTFERCFKNIPNECYEKLLSLEKSDNYKKRLYDVFKGEPVAPGKDYDEDDVMLYTVQKLIRGDVGTTDIYSKHFNKGATLNLTDENKERLVNCLYSDLLKRTVTEKYYPEETPLMYICFTFNGYYENGELVSYSDYESDEEAPPAELPEVEYWDNYGNDLFTFDSYENVITVAVTSDMESTVRFMKDVGVYEEMTAIPEYEAVEIIAVDDYEPNEIYYYSTEETAYFKANYISKGYYDGLADEGATLKGSTEIKDKEIIGEIAENAYTAYMTDSADGYYAALKTKDSQSVTIVYIPEGKLDSNVEKMVR